MLSCYISILILSYLLNEKKNPNLFSNNLIYAISDKPEKILLTYVQGGTGTEVRTFEWVSASEN